MSQQAPGPIDRPLAGLFEDLEQQAEALHLAERDASVADLAMAEYGAVALAGRLHASVGMTVRLGVVGVGFVHGRVRRVAAGWLRVAGGRGTPRDGVVSDWVVRIAAVRSARGLSDQAVSEPARPLVARLGIASVLRELCQTRAPVVVHQIDGSSTPGVVRRVGADFVELARDASSGPEGPAGTELVPLRWVAAIRRDAPQLG
jgi:hypothetical protein